MTHKNSDTEAHEEVSKRLLQMLADQVSQTDEDDGGTQDYKARLIEAMKGNSDAAPRCATPSE